MPPPPPVETPEKPEPPPKPVVEDEEEKVEPVEAPPAPVFVFKPPPIVVNEKAEKAASSIREAVNEDQEVSPNPIPRISSMTQTGLIEITFSEPLKTLPADVDISQLTFQEGSGTED